MDSGVEKPSSLASVNDMVQGIYSRAPLGIRLGLHMKSHPFSASSLSLFFSHSLDVPREPFFNKSLRAEKIKIKV